MTESHIENVNVTQPPPTPILWMSTAWANGKPRTIPQGKKDPYDTKLQVHGSSPIFIDGMGVMRVSGPVQRIYIMQPHENIRLTCQVRRREINPHDDTSRGHVFEVRTSEHHPEKEDKSGVAYAYYFRYDKGASYKKELTHPHYTGETARKAIEIDFAEWNTVTIECFNTPNGVKLVSKLNGSQVTSFEDTGSWIVPESGRTEIIKDGDPYPGPGQLYPAIILRDTHTDKEYKDVVIEEIRFDLFEFSDLILPYLKEQSSSVGALIDRKYLIKRDEQYHLTDDVLILEKMYLKAGFKLDPSLPFATQKCLANGTAFLGTPKRIITAGHCIAGVDIKNLLLVFGFVFDHLKGSPQSFPESDVYELEKIIDFKREEKEDWAVVELKRPVQNRMVLHRSEKPPVKGTPLYVMGHPIGLPQKTDWGARVKKEASHGINPHIFFSSLNTFGGNSGSPVFNLRTREVEGILIRGERDFNFNRERGEAVISSYYPSKAEEQCTTIQRVENALKAPPQANAPTAQALAKKADINVRSTSPQPTSGRK